MRGNHEDPNLSARYGLSEELQHKFGVQWEADAAADAEAEAEQHQSAVPLFTALFNVLPAALYVGRCGSTNAAQSSGAECEYLQFSHGSWELGYQPLALLAAAPSQWLHQHIGWVDRRKVWHQLMAAAPTTLHRLSALQHAVQTQQQSVSRSAALLYRQLTRKRYSYDLPSLSATKGGEEEGEEEEEEEEAESSPARPHTLGLMWHDFLLAPDGPHLSPVRHAQFDSESLGGAVVYHSGRGFGFSQDLLIPLMNLNPASSTAAKSGGARLRGIVRAHQHNNAWPTGPMLRHLQLRHGLVNLHEVRPHHSAAAAAADASPVASSLWPARPGYVFVTMLSASEAELGLRDDSFAVWSTDQAAPAFWTLDHHWTPHDPVHDDDDDEGEGEQQQTQQQRRSLAWHVETHRFPPLPV